MRCDDFGLEAAVVFKEIFLDVCENWESGIIPEYAFVSASHQQTWVRSLES